MTVLIPHTGANLQRVAVERGPSDVVCLTCLTTSGTTSSTTIYTLELNFVTLTPGDTDPDLGSNVDGTLQLVPGVIFDGVLGLLLSCSVQGTTNSNIFLYSTSKQ